MKGIRCNRNDFALFVFFRFVKLAVLRYTRAAYIIEKELANSCVRDVSYSLRRKTPAIDET